MPPGWNDPPPISPRTTGAYKLNQRVAYPLNAGSQPLTPRSSIPMATPPMGSPMATPPTGTPRGQGDAPIASAPPDEGNSKEDDAKLLEEIKEYVQKLGEVHGKDKSSEIGNRFEIMAKLWPDFDNKTKSYTYEALRNLHLNELEQAKEFQRKLVMECGPNVVHWILMIKILIANMSS